MLARGGAGRPNGVEAEDWFDCNALNQAIEAALTPGVMPVKRHSGSDACARGRERNEADPGRVFDQEDLRSPRKGTAGSGRQRAAWGTIAT